MHRWKILLLLACAGVAASPCSVRGESVLVQEQDGAGSVAPRHALVLISLAPEDLVLAGGGGDDAASLKAAVASSQEDLLQLRQLSTQLAAAKQELGKKRAQKQTVSAADKSQLDSLESAYRAQQTNVRAKLLTGLSPDLRNRIENALRHKQFDVKKEYLAIDCSDEQMKKLEHACVALAAAGGNAESLDSESREILAWAESRGEVAMARANFEDRLTAVRGVLQS